MLHAPNNGGTKQHTQKTNLNKLNLCNFSKKFSALRTTWTLGKTRQNCSYILRVSFCS